MNCVIMLCSLYKNKGYNIISYMQDINFIIFKNKFNVNVLNLDPNELIVTDFAVGS